jgi:hypothetical protein
MVGSQCQNSDDCPGIKLLRHRCNAKTPNDGTGDDIATTGVASGDDPNKWSIEKWRTLLLEDDRKVSTSRQGAN